MSLPLRRDDLVASGGGLRRWLDDLAQRSVVYDLTHGRAPFAAQVEVGRPSAAADATAMAPVRPVALPAPVRTVGPAAGPSLPAESWTDRALRVAMGAGRMVDDALRNPNRALIDYSPLGAVKASAEGLASGNPLPLLASMIPVGRGPSAATERELPEILYHGTGRQFDAFDLSKGGMNWADDVSRAGVNLTTKRDEAEWFAQQAVARSGGTPRVMAFTAEPKRPLVLTDNEIDAAYEALRNDWMRSGKDERDFQDFVSPAGDINRAYERAIQDRARPYHDAIRIESRGEPTWVIVRDPSILRPVPPVPPVTTP